MGRITKKDIEVFKNELKNINYYVDRISELNNMIETLEYDMENVKAVNYSKISSHSCNEHAIAMKRHSMSEKLQALELEKAECETILKRINRRLNLLTADERSILFSVIVNKVNYRTMCNRLNIKNTSTLFGIINDIIEKALSR